MKIEFNERPTISDLSSSNKEQGRTYAHRVMDCYASVPQPKANITQFNGANKCVCECAVIVHVCVCV